MKKYLFIVNILFALLPVQSAFAAIVNASYSVQDLIYTFVEPTAVDVYGIGIHDFDLNTDVTVSYTYDNDISNATSVYIDPTSYNYEFIGSPYGSTLNVNGSNVLTSSYLEVTVMNNLVVAVPDGGMPQYLIDAGLPDSFTGDALWIGGYSDDHVHPPIENGLVFFMEFWDLSGNWLVDDQSIPTLAPDESSLDLSILGIQQYDNGVLMFEAMTIVANNISTIPLPTAFWLFGSGLLGLLGAARRKVRS